MVENNSDDTWKLSPKGISSVRDGTPRGGQSDEFIVARPDGFPKQDSGVHKHYEKAFGHYITGRTQD